MIEEKPQILSERRAVGLVCRAGKEEADRLGQDVVDFLLDHDIEVQVSPGSCKVKNRRAPPTSVDGMDVDFVTVIGGDGTILDTLSRLKDKSTPLFCINMGTVGFMTESDVTSALAALEKILAGECIIERCTNLSSGIGDRTFEDALNEVYVASSTHGRLLTFNVYLDGTNISFGRADGVMVSTPSGSTAYALSAGGSILSPSLGAFILVPVCPPRSELRPLVIPDYCLVEIELAKAGAPGIVVIDGQVRWDVQPLERIWVKKSKGVTRFIRLYDNYYDRLRTRLVPSGV
jgi:NAD+ kinase